MSPLSEIPLSETAGGEGMSLLALLSEIAGGGIKF